jgi:predicted nucleic acid-binding protein
MVSLGMIASVVADASVLIILAKIQRIHLLRVLYGRVLIGPILKVEAIDEGKRVGAPGVQHVEQSLQDDWLAVERLGLAERQISRRLKRTTNLDNGEIEAIAMASHRGLMVILDDKEARTVAHALGLRYLGTAGVILEAYRQKHLSLNELEDAVSDMTEVMWLSPEVVVAILKKAREEQ